MNRIIVFCLAVPVFVLCMPVAAQEVAEKADGESMTGIPTTAELDIAGDILDSKVQLGLADCPITKLRRFRNRVKKWGEVNNRSADTPMVSWLPMDVIRTLPDQLEKPVYRVPGSNTRALFYFAFPDPEKENVSKVFYDARLDAQYSTKGFRSESVRGIPIKWELDPIAPQLWWHSYFLQHRGNPQHQLTAIPGALTASEDEFLYANAGRVVFRSTCLTTAQAAVGADIGIPIGKFASALDASFRGTRSTILLYGTFQSPLWALLSGEHGLEAEMKAKLGLWSLYERARETDHTGDDFANKEADQNRMYMTDFSGWLVIYARGRELSGTATLNTSASAGLGPLSVRGSLETALTTKESLTIDGYEVLIEPETVHFQDLPTTAEILEAWRNSPYAKKIVSASFDSGGNVDVTVPLEGFPPALCTQFKSDHVVASAANGNTVPVRVDVHTPNTENGCEVPFSVYNESTNQGEVATRIELDLIAMKMPYWMGAHDCITKKVTILED